MRRRWNCGISLLLLVFGISLGFTADSFNAEATNEDEKIYLFVGGELMIKRGRELYPVLSMNKKHVLVDRGGKIRRLSRQSDVLVRLRPTYSRGFLAIENLNFSFSSMLPSLIEARAISDMLRHQTGTATEMALVPKLSTGRRYRIDYEQLEQLKRDTDEFQKDITEQAESSALYADEEVDKVHIELEVLPEHDFEDVYLAVAVGYDQPASRKKDSDMVREYRVGSRYVGTLRAGQIEQIKFQFAPDPFVPRNAECELFFYHGEGNEIATNLSRRFRKMPESTFRILQKGEE